jgi:hypothetical protein
VNRLTRWTAVLGTLAVAAVAGWVSYLHCVAVVSVNGEPGMVGRLYPVLIDGLIVAASMVLLDAAYHEETAPALAWWLLSAGIGATVAVNVLSGVASGPLGAIVAAWPAGAFVGCYELLMMLVRASARRARAEAERAQAGLPAPLPAPATPGVPEVSGAHPTTAPANPTTAPVDLLTAPGVPVTAPANGSAPEPRVPAAPAAPAPAGAHLNGDGHKAARLFASELAAGRVPALRAIRTGMQVGQTKAQLIQADLRTRVPE